MLLNNDDDDDNDESYPNLSSLHSLPSLSLGFGRGGRVVLFKEFFFPFNLIFKYHRRKFHARSRNDRLLKGSIIKSITACQNSKAVEEAGLGGTEMRLGWISINSSSCYNSERAVWQHVIVTNS